MAFVAVGITTAAVGAGTSIVGGILNFRAAKKEGDRARRQNRKAKKEYQEQLEAYKNLDTSNPYLNMDNVMEDLTINQKEAEFSRQQFAQSQANIMSGLREAAGGSGIAALAQSLAQQGQLASQRSAASIGRQEATNQRAERSMAGQLQQLERKGEIYSRGLEQQRTETLLAMAQQRRAAALNRRSQAKMAKTAAITGAIQGVGEAAIAGVRLGALSNLGGGTSAKSLGIDPKAATTLDPVSVTSVSPTGGGDLPTIMRRDLGDAPNIGDTQSGGGFDEAFRQARLAKGKGQTFKGEEYGYYGSPGTLFTTNYRDEADKLGLAY